MQLFRKSSIESRNDSLFINGIHMPANPTKDFLDSIVGAKSIVRQVKVKNITESGHTYYAAYVYRGGLTIQKPRSDSMRLSISVRFSKGRHGKRNKEYLGLFTGKLNIDGLDLMTITTKDALIAAGFIPLDLRVGSRKMLLGYGKGRDERIYVLVGTDYETNLPMEVLIHRNLRLSK